MHTSSSLLAIATAFTSVNAEAVLGFNYGAARTTGEVKDQAAFEAEFKNAANLVGTDGVFTSARLYTMIQGGTPNQPIAAIPAAIATKTSLLLGLWASGGDANFDNEITALKNTIGQYCDQLGGLVVGLSVGSEDLYRNSPVGQAANAGVGTGPDTLLRYIQQTRDTIKGSCLEDVPITHVDTWTAFVDGANKPVIDAIDVLGVDAYPYFENTSPNSIENAPSRFQTAINNVRAVSDGKPLWVTETGWPVSGPLSGQAVASVENAQTYWEQVGCPNFGKMNIWWYTMQDADPDTPSPSFGLVGSELTTKPLYDLSCQGVTPSGTPASGGSSSSSASSSHQTDSAPFPASNNTNADAAPTHTVSSGSGSSSGSSSDSGSNSGSGSGSQASNSNGALPTTPSLAAGAERMSSLGAAAMALIFAALAL